MGSEFDYDSASVPDTAVADVVADIYSTGKLPPLSDAEREQRRIEKEIWRWECQQREEGRAFERERQQQELEAAARHEAALEQQEANRKARLALQERQRERDREQQLVGLSIRARQQEVWASNVENAARIGLAQRYRNTLMGELDAMINLPQPEPISSDEIIASDDLGSPNIADDNFNAGYWLQKPIFK
jgi:hypothetical protein